MEQKQMMESKVEESKVEESKAEIKKSDKVEGLLYTDVGSKMMPVYERVQLPNGKSIVKHTKDFDIDEFIQASNSQTDLAQLRQEMITSGQLPSINDEVIDCTLMPQNIHEVYDVINKIDDTYKALPDSIKSIFKTRDDFQKALIDGSYIDKVQDGLKTEYERQVKQAQAAAEAAKKESEGK